MLPEPSEFLEFLAPYADEIQDLARAVRIRLLEILSPVSEVVYDGGYIVTVAFTFTGYVTLVPSGL